VIGIRSLNSRHKYKDLGGVRPPTSFLALMYMRYPCYLFKRFNCNTRQVPEGYLSSKEKFQITKICKGKILNLQEYFNFQKMNYCSTWASSILLIILFSEMLKIFKENKIQKYFFLKKNKNFDGIFENTPFVEIYVYI